MNKDIQEKRENKLFWSISIAEAIPFLHSVIRPQLTSTDVSGLGTVWCHSPSFRSLGVCLHIQVGGVYCLMGGNRELVVLGATFTEKFVALDTLEISTVTDESLLMSEESSDVVLKLSLETLTNK